MKCCGSPTTFTGVKPVDPARAVQTALQAVLFSELLKPLGQTLGPAGDVVVESVAQHLFVPGRT